MNERLHDMSVEGMLLDVGILPEKEKEKKDTSNI
jgi:hypothetical protein